VNFLSTLSLRLESVTVEIEQMRAQLIEQKKQLEVERKQFTKAAIDLGRERVEISVRQPFSVVAVFLSSSDSSCFLFFTENPGCS